MKSRFDRLSTVKRWAVVAWVIWCAIQMIRWWQFDVPAMVAGWSWIGSFWGCLLCLIVQSRVHRNDWGARIALFAPTLLVMCVFFRKIWLEQGFEVGPAWLWPLWSLVFEIALLTWGWELPRHGRRPLLLVSIVVGLGGIAAVLATPDAYVGASVGTLASIVMVLLRKNDASTRPQGLTLFVSALALVDILLVISIAYEGGQAANLGLLALARMALETFVSWRISRPRHEGIELASVGGVNRLSFLPMRAIRMVGWCGVIVWTWFACWLYPRYVATGTSLNGYQGYRFTSNELRPGFLSGDDVLSEVSRASQQVHTSLEVHQSSDPLPEPLFAIQELKEIDIHVKATDESLKSLHRFPQLEIVTVRGTARLSEAGMKSLAALPNLKELRIYGVELSVSDFRWFTTHSQLELRLDVRMVTTNSDLKSNTQEGVNALSKIANLDMRLESTCDEALASYLCEIDSLRNLKLCDIQGITGPTLTRLVGLKSLQEPEFVIRAIGESISLAEIAEAANQMQSDMTLKLILPDEPLVDGDLRALERLGESRLALATLQERASREEFAFSEFGIDVRLTIEGDDAFQRLCAIRSFRWVSATVREVSVQGLTALSQFDDHSWWWSFSFDLTNLTCPASAWAALMQRVSLDQVLITPEAIQSDEDVAGLRTLQEKSSNKGSDRRNGVHVICDPPTVEMLGRLNRFAFPGQLVVNLTDQELSHDELFRLIDAIPKSEFDIDLRLPRTTHFTENEAVRLRALTRIDHLRLEITVSDSAMPELAKLPGLFELDLRESHLSPQGLEWLSKCKSLETLRINPGNHLQNVFKAVQGLKGELNRVHVIGSNADVLNIEALKFIEEDRETMDVSRSNEAVYLYFGTARIGVQTSKNGFVALIPENATLEDSRFEWPIQLPRPKTE